VAYIGGPTVSDIPSHHPDRLFKVIRAQLEKSRFKPAVHIWDVITPDLAQDLFTYLPPSTQMETVYSENMTYVKKHVIPPLGKLINFVLRGIMDRDFARFPNLNDN
jgi:hypothetical protein